MDKQQHIDYWLKTAQHDLESALSIFSSGRYDWALFIGHLALEKLLKALWVKTHDSNIPPRIHDLVKIAQETQLQLTPEEIIFLEEVTDLHIETRYPDYKFEFYKLCTKEFSQQKLQQIKEFFECTRKKL